MNLAARVLLGVLYLVTAVVFVVLANDNAQDVRIGGPVLLGVSLVVGLGANWWPACTLPLLLFPLSLPFGYANEWVGNDQPPLVLLATIWAPVSGVVILGATGARKAWELRRSGRSTAGQP